MGDPGRRCGGATTAWQRHQCAGTPSTLPTRVHLKAVSWAERLLAASIQRCLIIKPTTHCRAPCSGAGTPSKTLPSFQSELQVAIDVQSTKL